MLWQSLDFWAWQNVTRDSEPWERDPAMSARFLEAICSFDQVVPEIGKKKSPCPMMVSDTIQKLRPVNHPSERAYLLQMPVTCVMSVMRPNQPVSVAAVSYVDDSFPLRAQTGELLAPCHHRGSLTADGRNMRDARLFWLVSGVVGHGYFIRWVATDQRK